MLTIHNRYLRQWLHGLFSGALVGALSVGLGMLGRRFHVPVSLLFFALSALSPFLALAGALMAHRFSLVQGIARGDMKEGFFAKIASRDDAVDTVQAASIVFVVLPVLEAAVGGFVMPALITQAVVLAVLGGILIKWRSRAVAVLLLLCSGLEVVSIVGPFGFYLLAGTNVYWLVYLALIMLVIAVRAVDATFKLHGSFALQSAGAALDKP